MDNTSSYYDNRLITAKSRGIPLDMSAEQCAKIIASEGTNVAFYSLTVIRDHSEGFPKKAYRLRYATWDVYVAKMV